MSPDIKDKDSIQSPMGIRLRGIELLDGSLMRPDDTKEDLTAFQFNLNLVHDIDREKKLVFVIVHVDMTSVKLDKLVGSLSVSHIYELEKFDEVVTILDDNNFKLPEDLTDVLNSISISTTRGVMFSTFKGTFLHHALLPIVNPKQIQQTV